MFHGLLFGGIAISFFVIARYLNIWLGVKKKAFLSKEKE